MRLPDLKLEQGETRAKKIFAISFGMGEREGSVIGRRQKHETETNFSQGRNLKKNEAEPAALILARARAWQIRSSPCKVCFTRVAARRMLITRQFMLPCRDFETIRI